MEYHSALKKNEISPSAKTWIDLEGIILSEISQSEKDNYHMTSLRCEFTDPVMPGVILIVLKM